MGISTDIRMSSRRGYSDQSMNTNELLWNAQLSQKFLKGSPLTVSLQFYDILHKQSNVSRTLNAQMRSDTWSNAINSYIMLRIVYRLNIFPGGATSKSDSNKRGRNRDGDDEGPGGMGGPPPGEGGNAGGSGRGAGGAGGGPGGGGPGGGPSFF